MPESSPHTLLGFDYGRQRIGVAAGQTLTCTAQAVGLIRCRDGVPDWPAIQRLFNQWRPDALVVGMPYTMDGSAHALTPQVERFARQLQGRFHVPVHLCDERLSSHEADERRRDTGSRRSTDEHAAQVILETWLYLARS